MDDDVSWIFGYGSLMWEPGFAFEERCPARVFGWHRALCLLSVQNRGTRNRPGLVLALDRGGSCHGTAFRIDERQRSDVRAYLWRREMATGAYRAITLPVGLGDGRRVDALAFVARPDHDQYYRPKDLAEAASLVAQGRGAMGTSLEYLRNVVRHLDDLGIADGPLHRVLARAEKAAERTADHDRP